MKSHFIYNTGKCTLGIHLLVVLVIAVIWHTSPSNGSKWPSCNLTGPTEIGVPLIVPDVPPFSYYIQFSKRVFDAIAQGANSRHPNYKLSITWENNELNNTLDANIVRGIAQDPDTLAFFYPLSPDHVPVFIDELEKLGLEGKVPILGPLDTKVYLRTPYRHDIINLIGGNQEEMVALVNFATNTLGISRIAAFDSGPKIGIPLNATLDTQGRRLVAYKYQEFGKVTPGVDVQYFDESGAQAIVLGIGPDQIAEFIKEARNKSLLSDAVFLVPSVAGIVGGLELYLGSDPELYKNVYSTSSITLYNASDGKQPHESLSALFNDDINTYDPTVFADGAPYGYFPGVPHLEFELFAEWISTILDTIECSQLTRESLLDAIYGLPAVRVTLDSLVGTFKEDCSAQGELNCCNQGTNVEYISKLEGFSWSYQETYTWSGCSALAENAIIPFLVGTVGSDTELYSTGVQQGLRTGLEDAAQSAILLDYGSATVEEAIVFARELVDIDAVSMFIELDQVQVPLSLDSPVFGMGFHDAREDERPYHMSIFPELSDRLYTIFSREQGAYSALVLVGEESEVGYTLSRVSDLCYIWTDEFAIDMLTVQSLSDGWSQAQDYSFVIIVSTLGTSDSWSLSIQVLQSGTQPTYFTETFRMTADIDNITATFPDAMHVWTESIVVNNGTIDQSSLVSDYTGARDSAILTPMGYTSYLAGRILARILSSINGVPNGERVIRTIDDLKVFSVDSSTTVRFIDCNKGAGSASIIDGTFEYVIHTEEWSTCGAQRRVVTSEDSTSSDKSVPIAIGIVGGLIMICLCLCIIVVVCSFCLVVLIVAFGTLTTTWTANYYGKRRLIDTHEPIEPNYEELVIGDADFFQGSVATTLAKVYSQKYKKREDDAVTLLRLMDKNRSFSCSVMSNIYDACEHKSIFIDAISYIYCHIDINDRHKFIMANVELIIDKTLPKKEVDKSTGLEKPLTARDYQKALFSGGSLFVEMFRKIFLIYGGSNYIWNLLEDPVHKIEYQLKERSSSGIRNNIMSAEDDHIMDHRSIASTMTQTFYEKSIGNTLSSQAVPSTKEKNSTDGSQEGGGEDEGEGMNSLYGILESYCYMVIQQTFAYPLPSKVVDMMQVVIRRMLADNIQTDHIIHFMSRLIFSEIIGSALRNYKERGLVPPRDKKHETVSHDKALSNSLNVLASMIEVISTLPSEFYLIRRKPYEVNVFEGFKKNHKIWIWTIVEPCKMIQYSTESSFAPEERTSGYSDGGSADSLLSVRTGADVYEVGPRFMDKDELFDFLAHGFDNDNEEEDMELDNTFICSQTEAWYTLKITEELRNKSLMALLSMLHTYAKDLKITFEENAITYKTFRKLYGGILEGTISLNRIETGSKRAGTISSPKKGRDSVPAVEGLLFSEDDEEVELDNDDISISKRRKKKKTNTRKKTKKKGGKKPE